jgi:hypothetical protein
MPDIDGGVAQQHALPVRHCAELVHAAMTPDELVVEDELLEDELLEDELLEDELLEDELLEDELLDAGPAPVPVLLEETLPPVPDDELVDEAELVVAAALDVGPTIPWQWLTMQSPLGQGVEWAVQVPEAPHVYVTRSGPLQNGLPQTVPIGAGTVQAPSALQSAQHAPVHVAVQQWPVPETPQMSLAHWSWAEHAAPGPPFAMQTPEAPGFWQ